MLEDEDEDDEDIGPDVSQFTTWSAVQLGEYGKRHFQWKEDTVQIGDRECHRRQHCLPAGAGPQRPQDCQASLRNMVSCATFPFDSFPETLLQLSFRNEKSAETRESRLSAWVMTLLFMYLGSDSFACEICQMLVRNQKLHEKSQYRHKNRTNGWKDERLSNFFSWPFCFDVPMNWSMLGWKRGCRHMKWE